MPAWQAVFCAAYFGAVLLPLLAAFCWLFWYSVVRGGVHGRRKSR